MNLRNTEDAIKLKDVTEIFRLLLDDYIKNNKSTLLNKSMFSATKRFTFQWKIGGAFDSRCTFNFLC